MFARRFTFVCIVTALFGISFSTIVSHAGRQTPSWAAAAQQPCGLACAFGSGATF